MRLFSAWGTTQPRLAQALNLQGCTALSPLGSDYYWMCRFTLKRSMPKNKITPGNAEGRKHCCTYKINI